MSGSAKRFHRRLTGAGAMGAMANALIAAPKPDDTKLVMGHDKDHVYLTMVPPPVNASVKLTAEQCEHFLMEGAKVLHSFLKQHGKAK